ncbi:hypothetical protein [Streptomyces venezuelae]|uniref:Uncharacterized protein n=1 Tax=Streptomyces venezuelae TaxID=54571 RepID=A0A5P2BQ07_STRVZ|nr:hypothetical protein [Streptomyces venezuelae]QES32413.1 hypothetical protein DEJ48_02435 [Streptomyces venezuelae]
MTSTPRLVPAPTSLITEACSLLEYGIAKKCTDSHALHEALTQARTDFAAHPVLPVPVPLLHQLQRVLFTLCIHAGEEFAPGEKVVRFTRAADSIRTLLAGVAQSQDAPWSRPSPTTAAATRPA